jgi:hypothetical protein
MLTSQVGMNLSLLTEKYVAHFNIFRSLLLCTELQILTAKIPAVSDEYNTKYIIKFDGKDNL